MLSEELPVDVRSAVELSTLDIAIAGKKLDELAVYKGGSEFARYARLEVKRREAYRGMSTIEAIRDVYRLIAGDKLE
jgi:hypothetical protein